MFNPLTWGGGRIPPPWETFLNNSKTAQDIKMNFFEFNLTLMGVILHIMTILINLRSCHGNLLLWMCRGREKWRKLHICQDIGLILLKFGVGGIFGFKIQNQPKMFYTTSFWRQNDVKVKCPFFACRKCMTSLWRHLLFNFLKTSIFLVLIRDYQHTKFGLIWVKESKVTEGGGIRPPPGWECIESPRWDRVKITFSRTKSGVITLGARKQVWFFMNGMYMLI